ncbi:ribonuclease H-like domain, reverse transcriptase, RNA-dependent DNA polymerase [Tanacetum coccineum]
MPALEDIVYSDDDEDVGAEADMNNLDAFMPVSPIPTTRVHKDHPVEQIIGDLNSAPQTRRMTKNLEEHEEPKKVIHALKDPRWIEAMQEELLQFKLQEVWTLMELPNRKRAIGTKFRNKKDERGIVIKNKARLVAQGYTQEEGIYCDEVFAPVARIEAIRLFLAHASFKDFVVYQMDVKSAFLYVKQKKEGIFISQDKYVGEILKKFGFTDVKTTSTPMETQKPLLKDKDGEEVNVHMCRLMIGSLMYLTSSRPDIMFAVCACARYQVNPKVSHLHAVKRIFRYLKDQPKLGHWYPKDSLFDLVAYTDSDYVGASLDRKSTIGGKAKKGVRLIISKNRPRVLDMAKKEINVAEKEVSTADPVTNAGEVVTTASVKISTASPTKTIIADDLTLAQTLIEIRSAKPKVKGVVIEEQSESTTRTRPQQLPSKDKGKDIMEEPEKPTKRKDQIRHDEEVAQRLQAQMQAELEEEDRLVRQR